MKLLVVPRAHVLDVVRAHPDWAVVSMSDAGGDPVQLLAHRGPLLRTYFDDLTHVSASAIAAGYEPPLHDHASTIVAFLETLRGGPGLVVHCMQGTSRSTATVLAAAAMFDDPANAVATLDAAVEASERGGFRKGAPVKPNPRLTALFDDVLALEGTLLEPTLARWWPDRTLDEVWRDAKG